MEERNSLGQKKRSKSIIRPETKHCRKRFQGCFSGYSWHWRLGSIKVLDLDVTSLSVASSSLLVFATSLFVFACMIATYT